MKTTYLSLTLILILVSSEVNSQKTIAREWNDALLEAIRGDFARPTVHARNLFHSSALLYDIWALFEDGPQPVFFGKKYGDFQFPEIEINQTLNVDSAREIVISYAIYRLLRQRFRFSPSQAEAQLGFNQILLSRGLDVTFQGVDWSNGDLRALGNYMGQTMLDYGLTDGANEENQYANQYYEPANPGLTPNAFGNPWIEDLNKWQPLILEIFIDQSGQVLDDNTPPFLGAEWGNVTSFALNTGDLDIWEREGHQYKVYLDPGPPPYVGESDLFKWGFSLVAVWSSHLDPADSVKIDISPGAIGNVSNFPTSPEGQKEFYNFFEGGDIGEGHDLNPHTGLPYEPQMVYRGDYTRVLAEFWADGPDSETPPGHWYTILNYVNDHKLLEKRWEGTGEILDDLEWDVKAYLTLGGAVHDAAIAAWSVKAWYDYIRPISAIRAMGDLGQSSDQNFMSYHENGFPLHEDFIEVVQNHNDVVSGNLVGNKIGRIKLKAWRGHEEISNYLPGTVAAGVEWVYAQSWWPYQRPSFVTPPFAGYVSGHSTFSRAAAVILHKITGDPFFPGGMGTFPIEKNNFLVFEKGPSQSLELQWATYYDASDQTSLSRIWGGIHPPADDIPGRLMGQEIGEKAFDFANRLFKGEVATGLDNTINSVIIYPNPADSESEVEIKFNQKFSGTIKLMDLTGRVLVERNEYSVYKTFIELPEMTAGTYLITFSGDIVRGSRIIIVQ